MKDFILVRKHIWALGTCSSIAYAVYHWFKENGNKIIINKYKLNHDTEAIQTDVELHCLLVKLQAFSNIDERSFCKAVDNIDRLLFIETQLASRNIKPNLNDRPLSYQYFKKSVDNLENLVRKSKLHTSPQIPVHIHSIFKKIYSVLVDHWRNIMKLTNDVQMKL